MCRPPVLWLEPGALSTSHRAYRPETVSSSRMGAEPFWKTQDQGTYMFVQAGAEVGEITSPNGGTFFVIELPMLADIAAGKAPGFRVGVKAPQAAAE